MEKGFLIVLLAPLLSACATTPAPLATGPFADITPQAAQNQSLSGQRVRWGGSIVSTTPGQSDTCFEIVSRPLDSNARPEETDRSLGRFIACAPGFHDPAVYAKDREITVTGVLEAPVVSKIGDYDYRFPRVRAEQIYLWPKRIEYVPGYYYDPFYNPFWSPWPYRRWPYYW